MKFFKPVLMVITMCSIYLSYSLESSAQSASFQADFQNTMQIYDSVLSIAPPNMGPYPAGESQASKALRKQFEERGKFYPYGDYSMAKAADSMTLSLRVHGGCSNGNWKPVGPWGDPEPANNTPSHSTFHANKNGRLDCIAFKHGDTSIAYVGSGGGGGLWKVNVTTSEATNLNTDQISLHTGVGSVATNSNGRIVIATGHSYGRVNWDYWEFSCTGVYYTDDEGVNWYKATVNDKNNNDPFHYGEEHKQWVSKIITHPTNPNIMFMTTFNINVIFNGDEKSFGALYKSTNGGQTWNEVDNSALTNRYFRDIEFNPHNPDTIYLSSQNLYRTTDGGVTWQDVTSRLLGRPTKSTTQFLAQNHTYFIAVPAEGSDITNTDNVAILALNDAVPDEWELYHSNDALNTNVSSIITPIRRIEIQSSFPYHAGFTMSHDPDTLYIGGAIFQYSHDGGVDISTKNYWNGQIHPDIQNIITPPYKGTNGNVVLVCTDGGLYRSNDYGVSFLPTLNDELMVNQFYGLGAAQINDVLVGGTQDNYNFLKRDDGSWKAVGVGDGSRYCAVNPNDPSEYAYADLQNHFTIRLSTSTSISTTYGNSMRPFKYVHYEPSTLFAATDRMYRLRDNTTLNESSTFKKSLGADSIKMTAFNNAIAFDYCRNNPEVMYVSTEGQWKDGKDSIAGYHSSVDYGDVNGKSIYELFKSTDTGKTWTYIPVSLTGQTGRINSITVDPDNPDKFWFTWSGYARKCGSSCLMNQNVYYSTDGGQTVTPYSTGLPYGSTKDIVYQIGSNDLLYVALESGIYYRDASMSQWECFNNNLPVTNIQDIEINYCSGTLQAATFGRGIWESPLLLNSPGNTIGEEEIIQSNITWSDNKIIYSGVRVKSGATLTISGSSTTIFMPKNGLIIVEPNAKLIVNDATITNGCEECLWGGIRLEGDKTQVQSPLYQGSVELDGATIENAIVAIGNYDADKSINSSGGIIQAISTTFLNNEKAIDLTYYHKQASTFVKNYKAFFNLCTFDIDDDYKFDNGNGYTGSNPHRFFSHVSLYEVDGVIFNGCEFKNSNTGQYEGWGEGIFSTNAGFQVRSYCNSVTPTIPCNPGDLVKSSFTGFKHGIWIEHDNILNNFAVKVDQATFDYCSIGIRMNNQYLSHLTRNEFTIGNGKEIDIDAFDCHKNIGIFATSTSAPTIEDNIMNGVTHGGQHPDHENIGIIIEDTRGSDIQIYHNTLQDLHKGCLALGSNDRPYYYINASTGVQFLCNSFSNNEDDIYVSAEPDALGFHLRGIADYQGSAQKDAGNTFQGTTNTHLTNIGAPFNYYYDGISGSNQPTLLNAAPVINVVASLGQNSCPSNFDPSGGGTGWNTPLSSGSLTGVKANFFIHQTDRNDAVSTLEGFIDLGNTPDFINFINNCMVVDTPILRDTLLTITPYVSEDALRITADKNILDKTAFIDILKMNPDVLRNEEFLYYLGNSIPAPLSPGEIDILRLASTSSTARTDLEAEITGHNLLMSIHANEVIAHYLLDTTDVDKDSIPVWYDHQNNLHAEYAKAAFYTSSGDYSTASTVLNNIPTKFSLTSQQNDNHNAYKNTWNLLKSILDDDRTVLQMTSGEQTDLNDISSSGIGANSLISYTVGVITDQVGPSYRLACAEILLGEGKPGRQTNITNTKTSQELLKVYPNPAKDKVTFEYKLSENANINIEVANITGQVVYQTDLANNSGKITWNTNSIAAGVYTYKLVKDGQALQVGKLVITK